MTTKRRDIEALLTEYRDAGWRVTRKQKYYRVQCPRGQHQRWIHLTPSDPNYIRNALSWLHHQTCYGRFGDIDG
jgi:hypothetical protein